MRALAIVPAWNEERHLPAVLEELRLCAPSWDVCVVDDGSSDGTASVARERGAVLLQLPINLVIGSRYLGAGGFRSTALRRAGTRYLSWLLRLRCGARLTDPTSGFRVAGRRAIEMFAASYPSDYPEPEAIAFAIRSGLRVQEVPVVMRSRQHGTSSIGPGRTLYYLIKVSLALILLPVERRRNAELSG